MLAADAVALAAAEAFAGSVGPRGDADDDGQGDEDLEHGLFFLLR